ncbi:MAG: 3-deoxy-8-phosphooctulonate synthase [bacterium]
MRLTKEIAIGKIRIGGDAPFVLIAGPCVIESEKHSRNLAYSLKKITEDNKIPFIYKSSYDKANRSSIKSYRGPGLKEGLRILDQIKLELDIPVLSDVHTIAEIEQAKEVLDIIQIPAFLCRQTDLIIKVAATGKPINVKKGQFLSPWDMKNIIEKIETTGNHDILITERGFCFGYNNLVVDMRSLPIMAGFNYPVIFDGTHSVQLPGGNGDSSSGQREFIAPLTRAAMATGACNAIFLEVHDEPKNAPCDGANMFSLDALGELLGQLKEIDRTVRKIEKWV